MKTKVQMLVLVLILALAMTGLAGADSGVALPRWVASGGATDATSETVALRATLGQPVVGVVSGGDVSVGQGFWHGGTVSVPPGGGHALYLPLVQR